MDYRRKLFLNVSTNILQIIHLKKNQIKMFFYKIILIIKKKKKN